MIDQANHFILWGKRMESDLSWLVQEHLMNHSRKETPPNILRTNHRHFTLQADAQLYEAMHDPYKTKIASEEPRPSTCYRCGQFDD